MNDKLSDSGQMGAAYEAAGKAFRARLGARAPEDERHLQEIRSGESVVVRGHYDQIERVLRATGVPHLAVAAEQVERLDWSELQVLMISCPGHMPPDHGAPPSAAHPAIPAPRPRRTTTAPPPPPSSAATVARAGALRRDG